MKKLLMMILLIFVLAVPASAAEFTAPEVRQLRTIASKIARPPMVGVPDFT